MPDSLGQILNKIPSYCKAAESLKETLLAHLVVLGEIPAPTFEEANRIAMLQQRFSDQNLQDVATDGVGNCQAIIAGENPEKNILVVAHADTVFSDDVDHNITIEEDRLEGPGVGDNSLGLATLATLPCLLDALNIRLNSNVILLGVTRGLGRADLEGMRFYLQRAVQPIRTAICVEGVQLGRLSTTSIGMLRGEITCSVPDEYDWTRFGTGGAIFELNEIINQLVEIRLPKRPRTSIVMGSIRGGTSFSKLATEASLRFEIRSESAQMVDEIKSQIDDIITEALTSTSADIALDVLARRAPGGLASGHPLPRTTRAILKALEVDPRVAPSTSELSALIGDGIPGITLGVTTGERQHSLSEQIRLTPAYKGLAQLVALLCAIDGGLCDAD